MANIQPNLYNLQSQDGKTKVVYETTSFPGQPILNLTQAPGPIRHFSGSQIRTLNSEIVSILTLPDVAERLAGLGLDVQSSAPQQFGVILRKEAALWQQVVRDAGIKAE